MTDLLIYDTEATDADKRHGQITQFSAVQTNLEMTTERRYDLRVRPLPWVVVTPVALQVTKMEPEDLFRADAISEFEAAAKIAEILRVPYGRERIFVTYYGIEFDDELIRTTLFRNMQYAFQTTGKGASRVDMLDGIRLLHHLRPDLVNAVVDTEKDRLSWRLEKICPANGIAIDAHDALEDSVALTALTRLVRERAPWLWDALVRAGNPAKVDALVQKAEASGTPLFLFTHFGSPEILPVFPVAHDGKRRYVLADLRAEEYPETLEEADAVVGRKGTPLPIIRSNLSPIFVDPEHLQGIHDFDQAYLSEKISFIKGNPALAHTCAQLASRRDFVPPPDQTNEERIYDGFPDAADKALQKRFLATRSWVERAEMEFEDPRLSDFAARIVLDAVYAGHAVIGEDMRMRLEGRCAEALARPFAAADSRWATIASSLAADPPQSWVDWAVDHYCLDRDWGDGLDLDTSAGEGPVDSQRQFSFGF